MPISSIASGLPPLSPKIPGSAGSGNAGGADFGSTLKQAVGALQQLGQQADTKSLALAKGDPIDIHEVMIANEQAGLGFSMALQVRNKLVDAYTEIMRMSV
jgi:flagellar hook-basal body complex protein FliE